MAIKKGKSQTQDNMDLVTGELGNPNLMMMPKTLGAPTSEEDQDDDEFEEEDEVDPIFQLIETMNQRADRQEEFMMNLMAQQQQPQGQQQSTAPAELNFDDLPDPVEHREDFNKALAKRVTEYTQGHSQQLNQRTQMTQKLNQLGTDFAESYSDLAGKTTLFNAVVQQEVQRLRDQGADPQRAIFLNPKRFLDKVAQSMYAELDIDPEADYDDEHEDGELHQQQQQRRRSAKPKTRIVKGRTKGLTRNTGQRQTQGKKQEKPLSFSEQLRKQQLADNLI